jgi:uncharacterized protein YcbK (DUF882 family)
MIRLLQYLLLISALTATAHGTGDARTLKLYHTHTAESLEVTYYVNGDYDPEALHRLKIFLADWRNGAQLDMDPKVMDFLWRIQQASGVQGTFEVISAYRSRETNEMLRRRSSGVAKFSQHVNGRAIDVRLRGLDLEVLKETARQLQLGGVGYYPGSDFVHIDTARVRNW